MRFGLSRSPSPPLNRSAEEQQEIDDAVLTFRRHGEYEDPFKAWTLRTHKAAFNTAMKRYEDNPASLMATRKRELELHKKYIKESHDRQLEEVTAILQRMSIRRKQEEAKLLANYKERDRLLWQRIESVIKDEEDKTRKMQEAEEKLRREKEEQRRREEERKTIEEEKRKKEEQEKILQEELSRKKKEKEENEARRKAEEEEQKRIELDKYIRDRKEIGFSTADEDWNTARQSLMLVKQGYIPSVKADAKLRSVLSKGRRSIVPKIGQLTNSQEEINRITTTIIQIIRVQPPHPDPLYFALLSALAKAILMQAETEVSARPVTAVPLARVTIGFITQLEHFSEVLFARLIQRTGGWAIPIPVPKPADLTEVEYMKLRGYRTEREEQKDFENRIKGTMILYFAILISDVSQPMPQVWALPRFWTYLARLMSTPTLLRSDIAMQIIGYGLEVGGGHAKRTWGIQFIKLLALLYKSIQTMDGQADSLDVDVNQVGALGLEGRPARVKVALEIEKVMSS